MGVCVFAIESYDDYVAAMKTVAGANGAIRKNLEGDLPAVAKAAEELKTAMAEVEKYWAAKGVADAQEFAQNIQKAADQVHAAAAGGDAGAAAAAAKSMGASCQGCHQAHRDKGEDGKYTIK
jgi:cytochrome c556